MAATFKNTCRTLSVLLLLLFNRDLSVTAQTAPEGRRGIMVGQPLTSAPSPEPRLLFYLSGEKQSKADFAAGVTKW